MGLLRYGPGFYSSESLAFDSVLIERSAINNYISDGNVSIKATLFPHKKPPRFRCCLFFVKPSAAIQLASHFLCRA